MTAPVRYPRALRVLHWLVAALVAAQLGFALVNALAYEARPALAEWVVQAHVSLGVLLLALMLLRVATRFALAVPRLPDGMGPGKRRLALATHAALYALMIALPITGWLKFAALGYPVAAFGVLPLPVFDFMPDIARRARTAHDLLGLALGGLLVLHVTAALFHRRLTGTAVLPRMALRSGRSGGTDRPARA